MAFPQTFELSDLTSDSGFIVNGGVQGYDLLGTSVSGIGDVNGDGLNDVIISAYNSTVNSGGTFIIFGNNGGFPLNFDLATIDGNNGFFITSSIPSNEFGTAVSGAGDINGDGIDDIIVGDFFANVNNETNNGQAYVIFGRTTAFDPPALNVSDLDGSNGFTITGQQFSRLGRSVSNAGDVNGDGIDDIIIGAPSDASLNGQAFVVFGKPSNEAFDANIDASTLDGTNGFAIDGVSAISQSAFSVGGGGDINGDGIDDVIIGAPEASPNRRLGGQVFVVFGKPSNETFDATVELNNLAVEDGFSITNDVQNVASTGYSVSNAGDINGDGVDDIIVGAEQAYYSGQSYVIFGDSNGFGNNLNISDLDGSNGFTISSFGENANSINDLLGFSVSTAGDVNGDGFDDVIVGAPLAGNDDDGDPATENIGESYVIFGKSGGFAPRIEVSRLTSDIGSIIRGIEGGDASGRSVSNVGDINGDNVDDLIIGARRADPNGEDSGQAYVVFGDNTPNALTDPINRFQNSDLPGTFLFAGEDESRDIRQNFPNFIEEGEAFDVSEEPADGLIRINRFQNENVPGTFLFADEAESVGIRRDFPNFREEGIAFYVYGADANKGTDYYRFQNTDRPGTYIFVSQFERDTILSDFPQFNLEGIAFEVG